jgi:hypothetical protein
MTTSAIESITSWFERVLVASLELPNRWFGRPRGNLHRLTWAAERGDKLILELDGRLHLVITRPRDVADGELELTIGGFDRCTFDWEEYGRHPVSHAETFTEGQLRFVGQQVPKTED